ncbi:phage terminase large subunit family protein [Paenibacillus tyrfis]|uniref:phage terminase large subunit family protein n=1 Tax=Paenibacillus tyrfis TaxID=1501230 RepID=UPI0020A1F4C6|nr:terminase family protein [Paenibacillus tyrfis]MCP1306495.1 terminase family protein [Paenibacillus tyrfis]
MTKKKQQGPTIITPKDITSQTLLDALATEAGYLELLTEPALQFDDYQRDFLESVDRFQVYLKGRQLGFSFVSAARALARSQNLDDYTCIIASYKQDDSKEKIRYAKQIYDSLPDNYKKRRLIDNTTSLEFVSKSGRDSTGTRIIAQGKGPIRGKGSNNVLDIILDEFAFFGSYDDIVYTSAVPVLTRVKHGSLTVISTPLGKAGKFFDIWDGTKKYKNYKRRVIYWWDFSLLCKDVPRARREAESMHTLQRVEEFGTEQLIELFNAMDLEAFQQEFECAFIDDSTSYFPLAMVYACVMDDEGEGLSEQDKLTSNDFKVLREKTIGSLGGGYDVGRRKDASELVSLDDTGNGKILRLMATYKQSDFDLQEKEVSRFLEVAKPIRLCIDETGLGMDLAERLKKKYSGQVEPIPFTNATKEAMAIALHKEFERGRSGILIPNDRDLISQIVAIKREVTSTGAFRYAVERNEKHHGDKFWALALANHALSKGTTKPVGFSIKADISSVFGGEVTELYGGTYH